MTERKVDVDKPVGDRLKRFKARARFAVLVIGCIAGLMLGALGYVEVARQEVAAIATPAAQAANEIAALNVRVTYLMGALSLFATAAGALLVYRSLRQSEDALAFAREAAQAERRPWLETEITKVAMHFWGETITIEAMVRLKNLGHNPAANVRVGRRPFSRAAASNKLVFGKLEMPEVSPERPLTVLPGCQVVEMIRVEATPADLGAYTITVTRGGREVSSEPPPLMFHPQIEIIVEYSWGDPPKLGRTIKRYGIVPEEHRKDGFEHRTLTPVTKAVAQKLAAIDWGTTEAI